MNVKFFAAITLTLMKVKQYFNLMQLINKCMTEDNALGDNFQSFQQAFMTAFANLDEAMLPSRKSMLTPEIQEVDEQRVKLWRVIRNSTKDQVALADKKVSTAAGFVLSLINNHGDVPSLKVTERTAALTNLCQDLTTKYATQVATLNLTSFAEQLSESNDKYLNLYDQRLHEWSEYIDGEVAKARKAMDEAFENLCIMVASGILTQGMAPFKHFVDYVNEAIKVEKIAMGATTTKPEGGEQETPTTPGEGEQQPGEGEQKPGEGEQTPGTGESGEQQPGEQQPGEGEGTGKKYTVTTYDYAGEVIDRWEVEVGQPIVLPTPPAGYGWNPCPSVMPDRNVNVTCYDLATGM